MTMAAHLVATPGTGGAPLLPNTATDQTMSPILLGSLLLLAGGLGASAIRRSTASIR
ncbi:MAG: LPXTG cell wall anchor domain-containing protein [Candidatus Limnocylindria bacterium]